MNNAPPSRIVLGVSRCLLGEQVRYDGAARRDAYIVDILAPHVEFVPICPEVESGMGVPRPPVHLVGDPAQPRMLGVDDLRADFTARMVQFSTSTHLRIARLHGYILKSRSPSCGINDTPIFSADGNVHAHGAGLFTRAIIGCDVNLPLQDERALQAPDVRDQFFEQVFSYRRWHQQVAGAQTLVALREFHVTHKYSVLAHHQDSYRALGQMLAHAMLSPAFTAQYAERFFAALRRPTTRASHANVLQHLLGYFKKTATVAERHRVLELLSSYQQGMIELGRVLQELRCLNARYPNAYLLKQNYLYPEMDEMLLRGNERACSNSDSQSGSASADIGSL